MYTITDIKKYLAENGNHYYDKDTIKFFDARIEEYPDKHNIYMESIKDAFDEKRLYKVLVFAPNNNGYDLICNIKPWGYEAEEFANFKEAKNFKKALIKELGDMEIVKCSNEMDKAWEYTFVGSDGLSVTIDTKALLEKVRRMEKGNER